MGCRSW
ncbi:TPA: hypothetical protein N0F65_001650 [Lagenidium giganteum]|nr:TPA: hypothetical protein N0F65_001650 [Lagenidium giganteum]